MTIEGGQSPTSVIPWKSILEESKDQKGINNQIS